MSFNNPLGFATQIAQGLELMGELLGTIFLGVCHILVVQVPDNSQCALLGLSDFHSPSLWVASMFPSLVLKVMLKN